MTQKQKDQFNEWLTDRLPTLSTFDVQMIINHVDHYFSKTVVTDTISYDDENPDYIQGTEDGI